MFVQTLARTTFQWCLNIFSNFNKKSRISLFNSSLISINYNIITIIIIIIIITIIIIIIIHNFCLLSPFFITIYTSDETCHRFITTVFVIHNMSFPIFTTTTLEHISCHFFSHSNCIFCLLAFSSNKTFQCSGYRSCGSKCQGTWFNSFFQTIFKLRIIYIR